MMYLKEKKALLSFLERLRSGRFIETAGVDLAVKINDKHILTNPTGTHHNMMDVKIEDLVVMDYDGNIVEKGHLHAHAATPLSLELFKNFENVNAFFHAHSAFSTVFASANKPIPGTVNHLDSLGEVPCFYSDDKKVKAEFIKNPHDIAIPEAMVQRPDVASVFIDHIIPQLRQHYEPKREHIAKKGLAFTCYKHGLFTGAPDLDNAFEIYIMVELSAKVAVYQNMMELHEKLSKNED